MVKESLPPEATRLFFVRHGEPEPWVRGRCCGRRLDPALSPAGREQARRAAVALAGAEVGALLSSPSRRALETAREIAGATGIAPIVDERLCEVDFGAFEGLTFDEARRLDPAAYDAWMASPGEVRFPGGESWTDLRTRVLAALDELLAGATARRIALATHAGVIRVLVGEARGLRPDAAFGIALDHGGITVLHRERRAWAVRAINERP